MKIERISENQIRCTLNKADLAEKELMLSELAYGSEKARELFRELMQQASNELGFEVGDIPLMIEAIPVSAECLILIITKVEDPDELDTRFSRFSRHLAEVEADMEESDEEDDDFDIDIEKAGSSEKENNHPSKAADGLIEALGNLAQGLSALGANKQAKAQKQDSSKEIFRVYAFKSLEDVIEVAQSIKNMYHAHNSLYKDERSGYYYLYIMKGDHSDADFVKCCNMICEYGDRVKTSYATLEYFEEHFKIIIEENAVFALGNI